MAGYTSTSARVPYTTAQMRLLFGHSDGNGMIIPLADATIRRWRRAGLIPFVQISAKIYRYPREGVDRILAGMVLEGSWRKPQLEALRDESV